MVRYDVLKGQEDRMHGLPPDTTHDSLVVLWDRLYDAFIDLPDPRLARTCAADCAARR